MADDLLSDLTRIRDERLQGTRYLSERDDRVRHWADHLQRVARVDAMARGEWAVVFPDQSATVEYPKVPNIIQLKMDDVAGLASSVVPSIRCDPANERSRPRAEKRERIAEFYRQRNRYQIQASRYFIDLMVAGVSHKLVLPRWTNGAPDAPLIRRVDPRWALPDTHYQPEREIKNFLLHYQESRSALALAYPELGKPGKGESDLITVLEWYDGSEFIRVAEVHEGKSRRGVVLSRMPNLLSRVPVVSAARPTHDGQFRGVFDQTLGVMESGNRIKNLLIDAAAEQVASQPIEYDIENPEDWGTGAVLHARSPQGYMRRMPPDSASQSLFVTLQDTVSDAREAAVYPEARAGNIQQSVASAAFVSAITGNLSTEVAHLQRIEADAWGEALSLALEVDEKYLDDGEPKYISGSSQGRRFSESYKPSVDIKGDYGVRVEFGAAAGGDQFSFEIRLNQAFGSGLVSKRTAMENHPLIKDVVAEEKQLLKEQLLAAGLQFIAAQAANRDFTPGAAFIEALDEDEETQLTVLARLGEITQPPQPEPITGTEAFSEAGAIARGGISEENVPGVGELPQLSELGL